MNHLELQFISLLEQIHADLTLQYKTAINSSLEHCSNIKEPAMMQNLYHSFSDPFERAIHAIEDHILTAIPHSLNDCLIKANLLEDIIQDEHLKKYVIRPFVASMNALCGNYELASIETPQLSFSLL